MHCGMCLPTCPTYAETKNEKNSPRGRISLMRAIADGELDVSRAFADEMYYCLGCLACETACPAGVDYTGLFEASRAEIEAAEVLASPGRSFWRRVTLDFLFLHPRLFHFAARLLRFYQRTGLRKCVRGSGLLMLAPKRLRALEPLAPEISRRFSQQLIAPVERPRSGKPRFCVAMLTGCVQDVAFARLNRDTVEVLLANGCEVMTPRLQPCCGSLHAHNGELDQARVLARRNIDLYHLDSLDAIISNAGGCGSHLRKYGHLLKDDPDYAQKAKQWDDKLRDIHEWLAEIGFRKPSQDSAVPETNSVTYHESCHLCHGQKISREPRMILESLPGVDFVELPESNWCCGSAGIYNITQPEQSAKLQERKIRHIRGTRASAVAMANPGCHIQIEHGLAETGIVVTSPVSLLAEAYRRECRGDG